jgi:SAM-dependent methyltransferase
MTNFSTGKRRVSYINTNSRSPEYFIVKLLSNWIVDKVKKYLDVSKGYNNASVLDLGCGSQPLRSLLQSMRLNYYSTDVAPIEGVSIDYIVDFSKSLVNTPILKKKFDFILCSEVLEHIPDWDTFFCNLQQVTREGSVVILTSPFIYFLHEVPHDYFRGTPYAYSYYANRHSFEIIELEKAGDFYDVLGTIENASSEYMTASKNPFVRLGRRLLNHADKLQWRIRNSPRFQKYFYKETSFYLSTVAVLRRTT